MGLWKHPALGEALSAAETTEREHVGGETHLDSEEEIRLEGREIGPGVREPAHSLGGLGESANIWDRGVLE